MVRCTQSQKSWKRKTEKEYGDVLVMVVVFSSETRMHKEPFYFTELAVFRAL